MSPAQREACDFFVYIPQHSGNAPQNVLVLCSFYVEFLLWPSFAIGSTVGPFCAILVLPLHAAFVVYKPRGSLPFPLDAAIWFWAQEPRHPWTWRLRVLLSRAQMWRNACMPTGEPCPLPFADMLGTRYRRGICDSYNWLYCSICWCSMLRGKLLPVVPSCSIGRNGLKTLRCCIILPPGLVCQSIPGSRSVQCVGRDMQQWKRGNGPGCLLWAHFAPIQIIYTYPVSAHIPDFTWKDMKSSCSGNMLTKKNSLHESFRDGTWLDCVKGRFPAGTVRSLCWSGVP